MCPCDLRIKLTIYKEQSQYNIEKLISVLGDSPRYKELVEDYYATNNIFFSNFSLVYPFNDQFYQRKANIVSDMLSFLTGKIVKGIPNDFLLQKIERISQGLTEPALISLLCRLRFDPNFEIQSIIFHNSKAIFDIYLAATLAEKLVTKKLILLGYQEIIYKAILNIQVSQVIRK